MIGVVVVVMVQEILDVNIVQELEDYNVVLVWEEEKLYFIQLYICYYFIQLIVQFKNTIIKEVIDDTPLEDDLVAQAQGIEILKTNDYKLSHFEWSNSDSINRAANTAIEKSNTFLNSHNNERLLGQRITVSIIPIVQIHTTDNYDVFCYGTNKVIHTNNYPDRCCWGCCMM